MYKMVLEDLCEHKVDGIIISEKSTPTEIQDIILQVKQTIDYWEIEDIINALPQDVKLYTLYNGECNKIYY